MKILSEELIKAGAIKFVTERAMETHGKIKQAEAMGIDPAMFGRIPAMVTVIDSLFWLGMTVHAKTVTVDEVAKFADERMASAALKFPEKGITQDKIANRVMELRKFLDFCLEFYTRDSSGAANDGPQSALIVPPSEAH